MKCIEANLSLEEDFCQARLSSFHPDAFLRPSMVFMCQVMEVLACWLIFWRKEGLLDLGCAKRLKLRVSVQDLDEISPLKSMAKHLITTAGMFSHNNALGNSLLE